MKRMKQNAGFTLVELVVVIAILGILAGVGTVGYGAYVKNAQKNADKTTVSNIIRAAETGQYAFEYSLPLQVEGDGLKLPVGFVVLTNEGGVQTVQSSSNTQIVNSKEPCVMGDLSELVSGNTYVVKDASDFKSSIHSRGLKLDALSIDITAKVGDQAKFNTLEKVNSGKYCKIHSSFSILGDTGDLVLGSPSEFENKSNIFSAYNYWKDKTKVEIYDLSASNVYDPSNGHDTGKTFSAEMYTGTPAINADGVISDVLEAAYGSSYSSLSLEYPDWNKTKDGTAVNIGSGMPSMLNHSGEVLKLVDDSIQILASGLVGEGLGGIVADWTSAEQKTEYINTYANAVASQKEQYLNDWNAVDEGDAKTSGSWTGEGVFLGFEKDPNGTDINMKITRTAAVMSYNTSFYTYLQDQPLYGGHTSAEERDAHISTMKNWGDTGKIKDPYLICASAFENPNSTLDASVKGCTACQSTYKTYVSSGASSQNGEVMGNTMSMIHSNKEIVDNYVATGIADDMFKYYETYLKEFQNVYGEANKLAANKSAIVITVYQSTDGSLDFDVAPKEADPRNAS